MSTPGNGPIFWDARDTERMTCDCIEDAVTEYLDDVDAVPPAGTQIEVRGYARDVIDPSRCPRYLDRLLEYLDERYGDPEEFSEPTPAMMEAEEAFIAAVIAEYIVWSCREVAHATVTFGENGNIASISEVQR